MTSVSSHHARLRSAPLLGVLAAVVLLATSCTGGGPGSQEEFTEVLMRDGLLGEDESSGLSEQEAACISAAVFDRYGEDEDALGKLSAAPSVEYLDGEEGIPGFADFFATAVQSCLQAGPTG